MGNFLLLGGAGFIGSRLCEALVSQGHRVVVVDSLVEQVHGSSEPRVLNLPIEFIRADCASLEWAISDTLVGSEFDCVVHLVAETGTGQSMYEAQRYARANIETLARLNDLLVNPSGHFLPCRSRAVGKLSWLSPDKPLFKTKRVVLCSSRAVYGDARVDGLGSPYPSREDDRLDPRSIYGALKLAQEHLLFAGFSGVDTCALRFQNVYGEGQSLRNPYTGVATVFVGAALNNFPIRVYGDGQMTRDFVHVDDAVQALLLVMQRQELERSVYNVGTGQRVTIEGLAHMIMELTQSSSRLEVTGEELAGDVRHNFADIEAIESIGYRPSVDIQTGMARLIAWAAENRQEFDESRYTYSSEELRLRGMLKATN